MTQTKKAIISVTLIILICLPMLLLLCACEPDYYENGVRAKIFNKNSPNGYARVCEVDSNDSKVCVIPAYIQFQGRSYPVREIASYGALLFNKGYSDLCRDLEELVIPETVTLFDIESYTGIWLDQLDTLKNITVHPDNAVYSSIDGVLYSKDGRELIFYPPAKEGDVMCIGKDVRSLNIADYNFRNNNISSVGVEEGNVYFKAIDGVLCSYDGKTLIYVPPMSNIYNRYFAIPEGVEETSVLVLSYTNIDYLYIPNSFKGITDFTPSEDENGMIYNHPFRYINLYFESETLPQYLANVRFHDGYEQNFGVTREAFEELAQSSRVA